MSMVELVAYWVTQLWRRSARIPRKTRRLRAFYPINPLFRATTLADAGAVPIECEAPRTPWLMGKVRALLGSA